MNFESAVKRGEPPHISCSQNLTFRWLKYNTHFAFWMFHHISPSHHVLPAVKMQKIKEHFSFSIHFGRHSSSTGISRDIINSKCHKINFNPQNYKFTTFTLPEIASCIGWNQGQLYHQKIGFTLCVTKLLFYRFQHVQKWIRASRTLESTFQHMPVPCILITSCSRQPTCENASLVAMHAIISALSNQK